MRPSNRAPDEMRPVTLTSNYTMHAEGSVLVEFGNTRVLCTASVEERVPGFLRGQGKGWVTAEYGMLPRSTTERMGREAARGKQGGRTMEIQRLIGRSLRAVMDMTKLGERTITVDCDVIQADGGTRTASITGGFVALAEAIQKLQADGTLEENPLTGSVASISVGIYKGTPVLDLDYPEDSNAETDMNIVMTDAGQFIEVQGTAEGHPFSEEEMHQMFALAKKGISELSTLPENHSGRLDTVSQRIVLASNNAGKVREFNQLLAGSDFEVVPQSEFDVIEAEETGLTFVENAILKARNAAEHTGLPAIADDSGLEVDALDGAPGIYSARFAGIGANDQQNLGKLLADIKDVPDAQRSARFQCLMVYMRHAKDPTPQIFQGTWEGRILHTPQGDNGFGYDPVFFVPTHNCSSAELEPDVKNSLSHRGQALKQLIEALR